MVPRRRTDPGSDAILRAKISTCFETSAALVTKANGVSAEHELIVNRADVGNSSFNVVSQPIRVYADPGSLVFVQVDGRFPANAGSTLEIIRLNISGHLVDVP